MERLAKEFGLKFRGEAFSCLFVTKEDIVLRNFLGGCPEPDYNKFGGEKKENRLKNIILFTNSKEFLNHKRIPQGCVISWFDAKQELKLAEKIPDTNLRKRMVRLYKNILQHKRRCGSGLALVFKPITKKEEKIVKGILSHEFVHQLLNNNNIKFQRISENAWKWDEGLCVYMDYFSANRQNEFAKPPKPKAHLYGVYSEYAHKWYKLLKRAKSPEMRKLIILRQLDKLRKTKQSTTAPCV
ncbi:MAG: hypothetical protein QW771_03775 [Candidatus Micrarchaeia archaeon]